MEVILLELLIKIFINDISFKDREWWGKVIIVFCSGLMIGLLVVIIGGVIGFVVGLFFGGVGFVFGIIIGVGIGVVLGKVVGFFMGIKNIWEELNKKD